MSAQFEAGIDRVVQRHRETLAVADSRLLAEVERRLQRERCPGLVARAADWLPSGKACKRWAWRLLMLFLLYNCATALAEKSFSDTIDSWYRSEASINLDIYSKWLVRRLAVLLQLPHFGFVQRAAVGEPCMLPNPLHRQRPACTCGCRFNVTATRIGNVEKMQDNFDAILAHGKPRLFLLVNHRQKLVPFADIHRGVIAHLGDMQLGYNEVSSLSGPSVSGLDQVFADADQPPKASAIWWHFSHVEAVRHVRPLIVRPEFIGRHVEVTLARSLLFIGAEHPAGQEVPLGRLSRHDGQAFASGLAGETVLTIRSDDRCCRKPKNRVTRVVTLRPGRLVSLPSDCYELTAMRNGTGYSAVHFGSVPLAAGAGTEEVANGGSAGKK